MSLETAENLDNFVSSCTSDYCNSVARRNCAYLNDPNTYISVIEEFMSKHPIFNGVSVVQLHPSAENGYPHTRPPNIICIPSNSSFPALKTTLFHEIVHIHQRHNPELWASFLQSNDWVEVQKSVIPDRWLERCRYNPDTFLKPFWKYKNRYIPLPLFINPHMPLFHEIEVGWYDTVTGILEHSAPEVFTKKYGTNRQSEHPYEIYAVLLEEYQSLSEEFLNVYLSNR